VLAKPTKDISAVRRNLFLPCLVVGAPSFRVRRWRDLSSREAMKVRAAKHELPALWLRQKKHSERSHARTSSAPPSRFWCTSIRSVRTSAVAAWTRVSFAPTAIVGSSTAVRLALRRHANNGSVSHNVPTGARSKDGFELPNANSIYDFALQKESRIRVPPWRSSSLRWPSQTVASLSIPPWQRGSHMKHRRNRCVVRSAGVRPPTCAPSHWRNYLHAAVKFVACEPRHD